MPKKLKNYSLKIHKGARIKKKPKRHVTWSGWFMALTRKPNMKFYQKHTYKINKNEKPSVLQVIRLL